MQRKVIQQGPSTLGISLPSKWVKEHGIKKGNEVSLEEGEAGLVVNSGGRPDTEARVHISLKDMRQDNEKRPDRYIIRTIIINALRKGHRRINVTFENPGILRQITQCVDEVMGYEIAEQDSSHCIIENVVKLIDEDFEQHFKRFQHVIHNFSGIVRECIVAGKDNFDEISSNFVMLEKSYNTFCRFLMAQIAGNSREKAFLFASAEHLYQGARNMYYAAKIRCEKNPRISKKSLRYAILVFDYVTKTLDFISLRNISLVAGLNSIKNELTYHEAGGVLAQAKCGEESLLMLQLVFIARRMWDSVGPYMGYVL